MLLNVSVGTHIVGLKIVPDLVRGPLVLNPRSGALRGPSGSIRLSFAGREMLAILMGGGLVPADKLLAAAFPVECIQPTKPQHAMRVRVMRLRAALARVGLPGILINIHGLGYYLTLPPAQRVRVLTGSQIDLLDGLLATHPDQALVAALVATTDPTTRM